MQYRVLPIHKQFPETEDDFEIAVDPADMLASPYGWHFTDNAYSKCVSTIHCVTGD